MAALGSFCFKIHSVAFYVGSITLICLNGLNKNIFSVNQDLSYFCYDSIISLINTDADPEHMMFCL